MNKLKMICNISLITLCLFSCDPNRIKEDPSFYSVGFDNSLLSENDGYGGFRPVVRFALEFNRVQKEKGTIQVFFQHDKKFLDSAFFSNEDAVQFAYDSKPVFTRTIIDKEYNSLDVKVIEIHEDFISDDEIYLDSCYKDENNVTHWVFDFSFVDTFAIDELPKNGYSIIYELGFIDENNELFNSYDIAKKFNCSVGLCGSGCNRVFYEINNDEITIKPPEKLFLYCGV